jgi:hypothetical protein
MAGSGTQESETSSSSSATFKNGVERRKKTDGKGKTLGKREERAVIVDINETGDGVVRASSLRASWQIINTEISNAPTISNNNTGGDGGVEEGERALMLKIEGIGLGDSSLEEEFRDIGEKRKGKGAGENSVMGEEEMLALLEGFDRKMSVLRKIAASGENTDEMLRVKSVGDADGAKEL